MPKSVVCESAGCESTIATEPPPPLVLQPALSITPASAVHLTNLRTARGNILALCDICDPRAANHFTVITCRSESPKPPDGMRPDAPLTKLCGVSCSEEQTGLMSQ